MDLLRKASIFFSIFFMQNAIILYAQEYRGLNITPATKLPQDTSLLSSPLSTKELLTDMQAPANMKFKKESDIIPKFDIEKNTFKSTYPRLIAPTAFIVYGIMAQENHALKELDKSTNHEVDEHFSHQMRYDDYIQFMPALSVYGLNLAGIKGRHNLKDVTIVMATSHLLMAGTVNILKSSTNVLRPDGSSYNSFPSGHTATSFVGAHILFREYIGISPYIAFSGYLVSSTTGVLRVLNKRHWVSDVMMGAGIGMLSVEAAYFLLPLINSVLYPNASKSKKQLAIVPSIGKNEYEMGIVYLF